ncbi:MAG TPA: HEAT repeat domain-containing protein [Polyangiaceae bacterium]|nr:HEAT repeat domain-containing protein [Polyangiaceae bacterium]
MAQKALASSRFWQIWTFLGGIGTVLAGARLLAPTRAAPQQLVTQASERPESRTQLQPMLENAPAPVPRDDTPFERLAVAATSTERCALLEQLQGSDDTRATYAITAVLERARLGSVRTCATQALGRQPTAEARSWLVDLAEDPEPDVHRSALESLATRDDASLAVVAEATHSEDLELRVSAVNALLKSKRAEAYAAAVLVLPLIEDAEMLSSLIDALGESHDPRALPALEGLLENADRESHLHAISAMGELGVASAAVRLAEFLEVGSKEEFSAAVEALNQLVPERIFEQLQGVLNSGTHERRMLALSLMASLKLPGLASALRQQLQSGDPSRVSFVLSRLTRAPDPAFEADLVAFAERASAHEKFQALRALARLETPSARAVVERLSRSLPDSLAEQLPIPNADDPDPTPERRIASLLSTTGRRTRTLLEIARDPAQSNQEGLLRYLSENDLGAGDLALVVQSAPASTVQRLIAHSASASESEREGLMRGLGRRGDPRFADALRVHLQDPSTRDAALTALVELGDDCVLPELQRLAKSSEESDRNLAVQLLATRTDPEASAELERLASDASTEVMSAALHALQTRSPELVARIAERALREASPEDRASLLSSLSDLKGNLSRPLLERSLQDADDSVAVQAIQSLGNLQGPATAQHLLAVVSDPSRSEEVRREAANALRSLGGPLARANRALLDSLSEPEAEGTFECNN